jgi:hypothetical protein
MVAEPGATDAAGRAGLGVVSILKSWVEHAWGRIEAVVSLRKFYAQKIRLIMSMNPTWANR